MTFQRSEFCLDGGKELSPLTGLSKFQKITKIGWKHLESRAPFYCFLSMDKPQRIFFYFWVGGGGVVGGGESKIHVDGVKSPPLFSMSEGENDRERLTRLWGFLPGLIQGCITTSVSPLESQSSCVFSLINRRTSGLLYTKSGKDPSLLTR